MKKTNFKRICLTAVLLLCAVSAFAAKNTKTKTTKVSRPDVWILDLTDAFDRANGEFEYWYDENTGDSGYGLDLDFIANAAFALPRKGDKILITGKIISDIDLPYLEAAFIDNSNGWTNVSWCETIAENIKAGVPYEIDHEILIREDAKGQFFLRCEYDLCWGDYENMPKVSKQAKMSFDRVNQSTDSYTFKETSAEKWVIDICDSDTGDKRSFRKEPDATLYYSDGRYDALFAGVFPRKGDFIELHLKGVSDTDIESLSVQPVDNSEAAGWWMDIASNYDNRILNIKAGVPFSYKILVPVANAPKEDVMLRLHYDGEWEREWRKTPNIGKPVNITFERDTASFDRAEMCEKIGVNNPPKVYTFDLADSDLGSEFTIDWDDAEWAKSYRKILSFRHLIRGDMPKKDDFIVFNYDMTFSEDLPYLAFQIADCSKKNSWNQPYKPDYFDFTDIKAGQPVRGKSVVQVKDLPIFDTNLQMIYDASWQLENHPAAGKATDVKFTRVTDSTDTVKRRAPKTYKVDASKLAKDLKFNTLDRNFNYTTNPFDVHYYLSAVDITSLFKGDLPRKGDIVEVTYNSSVSEDFSGMLFFLYEENDYVWARPIASVPIRDNIPVFTEMDIKKGKKFKYKKSFQIVEDADVTVNLQFAFEK